MNTARPVFAVLIAACNRPSLLARRALPSVAAQIRQPDLVVVADDSLPQIRDRNKKAAEEFSVISGARIAYTVNKRSKGACGAWNSGVLAALRALAAHDARGAYLAVLDDDDEWMPEHLAQAEKNLRVSARGVDVMAAAFERREAKQKYAVQPPLKLDRRNFLTGNPGVVGSTLIIRLAAFLRAGMFDESLPACTDRDLCIRLSLLPGVSYKPLLRTSAIHYADDNRVRLSNKGGAARLAGLSRFAGKYRGWMTDAEYDAFSRRAKRLFGWTGGKRKIISAPKVVEKTAQPQKTSGKIALVAGIIVHPRQKNNALFSDILRLSKDRRLSSADIVVMPSSGRHCREFRGEMEKWRRAGLRMHCIGGLRRGSPLHEFLAPDKFPNTRPIAVNRTILQHAVSRFATLYRNPVCWILDGDNRLHGLKIKNRRVAKYIPDYIGEMARFRESGCDIAVGEINGAAPLPRTFTVRTQMVDLLHALARLQRDGKDKHSPELTLAGAEKRGIAKNYYHDCFPHPHLEQPAGVLPKKYSLTGFLRELPKLLSRILAGDAVTRPLLSSGGAVSDNIHRGGNTLIFNAEVLCECPNGLVRGGVSGLRRADEMWRIMCGSAFNRKIVAGNFPVTQSRENELPQAPDIERAAADIAGHAVVVALRAVAGKKQFGGAAELINVLLRQDSGFWKEMRRAASERLSMAEASFFRICGIAASMRGMIKKNGGGEAGRAAAVALANIERRFAPSKTRLLKKRADEKLNPDILRRAFSDFPALCNDYGAVQKAWAPWMRKERRANALALLEKTGAAKTPLRFLGEGGEGAAFAGGGHVYKVLHRWYSRADIANAEFLPSLAGQWKTDEDWNPVLNARKDCGDLILTMPFEKTAPYKGGCGAGMAALLASLRRKKIALWDIAPKNLRRKNGKVRLIDYGQHINPFTEKDFDLSVRKAWLCWRWAFREDLRSLLTASLTNRDLPELNGYENMKTAVELYAAHSRPEDAAVAEVLRHSPRRILDYGCGKGRDAAALAARGIATDAFDLKIAKDAAARLKSAKVRFMQKTPNVRNVYGVILLRHVLCEIFDNGELRRCLQNIYRMLAPGGKVVATACAPGGIIKNSMYARNILPRAANFERKFYYRKFIRATCRTRSHVHRPEAMLEREFACAGFKIISRRVFRDMDLDRFEPCDGVVQWTIVRRSESEAGQ